MGIYASLEIGFVIKGVTYKELVAAAEKAGLEEVVVEDDDVCIDGLHVECEGEGHPLTISVGEVGPGDPDYTEAKYPTVDAVRQLIFKVLPEAGVEWAMFNVWR